MRSWIIATLAVTVSLWHGGAASGAEARVAIGQPTVFWHNGEWQTYKGGVWTPYGKTPAETARAEDRSDRALRPGRGEGDRGAGRRGRPGWTAPEGNATQPADQSNVAIGQPTIGIGQNTIAIGQPNTQIGQPTIGIGRPNGQIGRPTIGIGQPNGQIGQPTIGIGQPNGQIGRTTTGIGQPNGQIGQPTIGIGQPNGGIGQTTIGIGQPNSISPSAHREPKPVEPPRDRDSDRGAHRNPKGQ